MKPGQKRTFFAACLALGLAALVLLALVPLYQENRKWAKNIAAQKRQLAEMKSLASALPRLESLPRPASLASDFSLFAFLEQAAAQAQVKGHIKSMQPVHSVDDKNTEAEGSAVELRLQGLDFQRLARFLQAAEAPEQLIYVERMSIQRAETGAFLDLSLRVRARAPGEAEALP